MTEVKNSDYPVEADDIEKGYRVSNLKVMRSAAGFYVGREGWNPLGFPEPFSRETGYFRTENDAAKTLRAVEFPVRDCMENDAMYESGIVSKPNLEG